jgi:aminoglycoside phosphotransferase (APT) family kinase protein
MYRHDEPKLAGLIDWELSTLGDPLLDLGWMLSSWTEEGDPHGRNTVITPWDGFMSRAELIRLYGELTGRDMAEMPWFFTMACYKLALLLEGSYARSFSGKAPKDLGEKLHNVGLWLLAKADQLTVKA